MSRRLTVQEEYLTSLLVTAATKGKWCEKCKVHHRDKTKCPYAGKQTKQPSAPKPVPREDWGPGWKPEPSAHAGPPPGTVTDKTVADLTATIAAGKLAPGLNAEQHIELGKQVIDAHKEAFPALMDALRAAAPPTARVMGRVKELDSLVGKLSRKPDIYKSAKDMGDTTGTRIVCNSIDEVKSTVAKLKQQFEVVEEEDFIDQPNYNYRSHHLNVRDKDGRVKEIQIRTENQDTWANWGHNIYKPLTDAQRQALETNKQEITSYAKSMSEYFYQADQGKPAQPPPCTIVIHKTFGCLS